MRSRKHVCQWLSILCSVEGLDLWLPVSSPPLPRVPQGEEHPSQAKLPSYPQYLKLLPPGQIPKAVAPSCTMEHGWGWSILLQDITCGFPRGCWKMRTWEWGEVNTPPGDWTMKDKKLWGETDQFLSFYPPAIAPRCHASKLKGSLITKETAVYEAPASSITHQFLFTFLPPCLILSLAHLGWEYTFPGSLSSLALSPALFSRKPRLGQRPCRWKVPTTRISEKKRP